MNLARIENIIGIANLTWRNTVVLTAAGVLIGLALAMGIRLPVT